MTTQPVFNVPAYGTLHPTASTLVEASRIMAITRTDNLAAHRFFGMGFAIGAVDFAWSMGRMAMMVRFGFQCICGRFEVFQGMVRDDAELQHLNCFEALRGIGSLSRDHLLADGYSEAQIADMEERYERYMWKAGFTRYPIDYGRPEDLTRYPRDYERPEDHPPRHALLRGSETWIHRGDRVPPVPGVDPDFAVRLLREGGYFRLAERPEPSEQLQRHGPQVCGTVDRPDVPGMPRSLRE